jgi:foldase protein PrsA
MKKPPGRAKLWAAALVGALALAGCGTLFEPTAAVVNDHKITVKEVDAVGERFTESSRYKELAKDGGQEEARRQIEQTYLASLISRNILEGLAKAEGIEVTEAEVTDQIATIKKSFASQEEFDKALGDEGVTMTELPDLVRGQILEAKLRQKVAEDAAATPAEVRAYYDSHIDDFRQIRASHILVKKRALADQLSKRLQNTPVSSRAQLFAKLAKKNSIDTGSGPKGGDLGLAPSSKYVPSFAAALEALDVNEVSDPVQSQFGYHVILVTEKVTQSFAEAKASIEKQLATEQGDKAWTDYITKAYEDADIRVNPRYGVLDTSTRRITDTPPEDVPGSDVQPSATPSPTA